MRTIILLAACGFLLYRFDPDIGNRLTTLISENQSSFDVTNVSAETLMAPGLWSISASMDAGGQVMQNTQTHCFTPDDVQHILSSGGQSLIEGNAGQGCQVSSALNGQVLSSNGQCTEGNGTVQMGLSITFQSPTHFVETMSENDSSQGDSEMSATAEGTRIGDCNVSG
jgi:hypothetical protein